MFDRILFDRNAFDRSVSSDFFIHRILGFGKIELNLTVKTPITGEISSFGTILSTSIIMPYKLSNSIIGEGNVNCNLVLHRIISPIVASEGNLSVKITIKTPTTSEIIGSSNLIMDETITRYINLKTVSDFADIEKCEVNLTLRTELVCSFNGNGSVKNMELEMPLSLSDPNDPQILNGFGNLTLNRLGSLNENLIELLDLDFKPGDTIIVDTDLLQVLINSIEDVSSVTQDSVFFELNPGINEIKFSIGGDDAIDPEEQTLDILATWQNRWL